MCTSIYLKGQSLAFAEKYAGGGQTAQSIVLDAAGNIYTTGSFAGTRDFDPGAGTFNLAAGAGNEDAFITKFDAAGNFIWAKQIVGAGAQAGLHIALDAAGNIYVAGTFANTPDFDPGVGVFTIATSGALDNFVVKLNPAGNFLWAKSIGGSFGGSDNIINSLAVDPVGNVYFTGAIQGGGQSFDLDPNAGTFLLTLPGTAFFNIYAAKWDANGNFVWANQLVAPVGLNSSGNDIELDAFGNVYIVGSFSDVLDFNPGPGVFNMGIAGTVHAFLWVLNSGGGFIGALEMGGSFINEYASANDMEFDASGNVYIAGDFAGAADFDPGPGIFTLNTLNNARIDPFILKLNAVGALLWAKHFPSSGGFAPANSINKIAIDNTCGVYAIGQALLSGTLDLDPNAGVFNIFGGNSSFQLLLNPSGNFVWGQVIPYGINDITVDATGNLYEVGGFTGTLDFDMNPNTVFNMTGVAASNAFLVKLLPSPWSPTVVSPVSACLNGTDTLSATTVLNNGNTLAWYSAATGGIFLGSGTTYTTPVLTDTTTFYVQDSTCQAGPRDSITINTISCVSLPITLLSFDAYLQNEAVQTEWITTTEINNDFFTVERSLDAIHFEPIGTKQGAGNSSTNQYYTYMDSPPLSLGESGWAYYRLKQTDFDGNYEYFDVKAVHIEKNTSLDNVEVYPNPTTGKIFISWNEKQTNILTIQLTDNLGKKISTTFITQKNRIQLNMNEDFPKGIYYLKLQTTTEMIVKKIIKN